MNTFNLGSHNSLTYLKPKYWWMRLINFTAKCQKLNYSDQYDRGVRLFDVRIWYTEKGELEIRHGRISYQFDISDLTEFMDFLNVKKDCWLRIILEEDIIASKQTNKKINEERFINTCADLEKYWPNVKMFGGQRKYDWKQLYQFKYIQPNIVNLYSSTTSLFKNNSKLLRFIDDWWPWLYARLRNKTNIDQFIRNTDNKGKWLLIDFIN
jgi:hypothetical protein